MIKLAKGIDSLTNFKRKTGNFVDQLRQSGEPLVLTINGKAELVVQDAASYQKMLEQLDRLEAIEGIKKGLDDIDKGRTRAIEDLIVQKKKKHGL